MVKLPRGFALYGHGSLNASAYDFNGNVLAQTPRSTAAVGLIYDQGNSFQNSDNLYGSIISRSIRPQYGMDTAAVGQANSFPIKSYNQFDLAGGYRFSFNNRKLMFKFNLYNLLNDKSIIGFVGQTVGPTSQPLFFTNSGRSVFFSLSARI